MSKLCYVEKENSTEPIDLKEIILPSEEDKLVLIESNYSTINNCFQTINRLSVDVQTANKFPAYISKQNDYTFQLSDIYKRTKNSILGLQELDQILNQYGFTLRNKLEIILFILDHTEIIPILEEVQLIIGSFFKKSKLVLELNVDPEEDTSMLFIYIQTRLPTKQAMENLGKLDEIWWLKRANEIGELVCLHIECL